VENELKLDKCKAKCFELVHGINQRLEVQIEKEFD
jgi:hypothetical protein